MTRNQITKIINLEKSNEFCMLASRLHFFEFDVNNELENNKKNELIYIPYIEYI